MKNSKINENDLLIMANLSNEDEIEVMIDMINYCKEKSAENLISEKTYLKIKNDLVKALKRLLFKSKKRKNDATKIS